ncbi:MAG: hypothetical protein AABP62_02980 [Planctomycetota bacterium]
MGPEIIGLAAACCSAVAAIGSIVVAWLIFAGQKTLSQRQLIVPLWEYMTKVESVRDASGLVIPAQVIRTANTLELIAICCEGEMIDKQVILRVFRNQYMFHFLSIDSIVEVIDGIGKNGHDFLMANHRASIAFYKQLEELHLKGDAL